MREESSSIPSARFKLAGGRDEGGGGIHGGVVEVDFFDEADGQLIVGEIDVFAGVETGAAVLAHPPEGHGAEDGDGRIGGGTGGEGLEDIGPIISNRARWVGLRRVD